MNGQTEDIGDFQLPLSEGTINDNYKLVGFILLKDALKRQPRMYTLSIGGMTRTLPRLLTGTGWKLCLVPFYFRVGSLHGQPAGRPQAVW